MTHKSVLEVEVSSIRESNTEMCIAPFKLWPATAQTAWELPRIYAMFSICLCPCFPLISIYIETTR